ncbi:hypothetical protein SDC9_114529 [bioreactor metagenome]|uniref:Thioredoxin domain-containing protein n=1 Tax=bioreactor metagenome TaxID=1076179 RepID=A0A645BQN2_9ZZZZ
MSEDTRRQFSTFGETINKNSSFYSHLVDAWQYVSNSYKNLILVGKKDDILMLQMLKEINSIYLPYTQVVVKDEEYSIEDIIQSLKDKKALNNNVTAYICENYTCKEPVIDLQSFKKNIE